MRKGLAENREEVAAQLAAHQATQTEAVEAAVAAGRETMRAELQGHSDQHRQALEQLTAEHQQALQAGLQQANELAAARYQTITDAAARQRQHVVASMQLFMNTVSQQMATLQQLDDPVTEES